MTGVYAIDYLYDGSMVFAGCQDGSLQGFSTKMNFHRPEMKVLEAHSPL